MKYPYVLWFSVSRQKYVPCGIVLVVVGMSVQQLKYFIHLTTQNWGTGLIFFDRYP